MGIPSGSKVRVLHACVSASNSRTVLFLVMSYALWKPLSPSRQAEEAKRSLSERPVPHAMSAVTCLRSVGATEKQRGNLLPSVTRYTELIYELKTNAVR